MRKTSLGTPPGNRALRPLPARRHHQEAKDPMNNARGCERHPRNGDGETGTLFRVAAGNGAGVEECIRRYGGLVWSLARRFTRTPADAEDATQEIFLEIWQHANRFDPSLGSEQTFIATLARRRLIDGLRKNSAEPTVDHDIDVTDCLVLLDGFESLGSFIDADIARNAISRLRPEYRQALELAFLGGLSHAQIARHLDMPLGTIKCYIRRALLQLRTILSVGGASDEPEASAGDVDRDLSSLTAKSHLKEGRCEAVFKTLRVRNFSYSNSLV